MDSNSTNEELRKIPRPQEAVRVCDSFKRTERYVVSGSMASTLNDIMEALADANIYKIGVCGNDDEQMTSALKMVERRVTRDSLCGVIVMLSIGENPNLTRIQQDIANQLGLSLEGQGSKDKSAFLLCGAADVKNSSSLVAENAGQLYDRIMMEPSILFILRDLQSIIDLVKIGIPIGEVHKGCKLVLASQNEELLSNQMTTQRTFKL